MRRWLAVINHSRMSGKPPQAAEIDWHGDLQKYLAPESEVIQITIYRRTGPLKKVMLRLRRAYWPPILAVWFCYLKVRSGST